MRINKRFLALSLLVLFTGCRNQVDVTHWRSERNHWKGAYLLSPKAVESLQGRGYSVLSFVGAGRAILFAVDRAAPELLWVAQASIHRSLHEKDKTLLGLKCESVSVVELKAPGRIGNKIFFHSTPEAFGELTGTDEERARAADFRSHSPVLREGVPQDFLDCTGNSVPLERKMNAGGLVIALGRGAETLEYFPHAAHEYATVVDGFARPSRDFALWAPAASLPELGGSLVAEDPRNVYLPAPRSHRYYILGKPGLEKGAFLFENGRLALPLTQTERLDLKAHPGLKLPPGVREALELARWERPTLKLVRVTALDGMRGGISSEINAEMSVESSRRLEIPWNEVPAGDATFRLDAEYGLSDGTALSASIVIVTRGGRVVETRNQTFRAP